MFADRLYRCHERGLLVWWLIISVILLIVSIVSGCAMGCHVIIALILSSSCGSARLILVLSWYINEVLFDDMWVEAVCCMLHIECSIDIWSPSGSIRAM